MLRVSPISICGNLRNLRLMTFSSDENFARQLDRDDPLRDFREKFSLPLGKDGKPVIYFAGNSLGPMPKSARQIVVDELDDWANVGVDAHHATGTPWYSYHETLREPTAQLVGAKPLEVICMNSLTVNLHLMLATFYRPTKSRSKILMEEPAFPSDTYAIKTQLIHHGLDAQDALVLARPRKGEFTVRTEDILDVIEKHADHLAVVIIGAVNFFTGQLMDIEKITVMARKHGIMVGFDLAHAAGNVPLSLHEWNVDFAVWCSYKYLNAGPGAVEGEVRVELGALRGRGKLLEVADVGQRLTAGTRVAPRRLVVPTTVDEQVQVKLSRHAGTSRCGLSPSGRGGLLVGIRWARHREPGRCTVDMLSQKVM